MNLEAMQNKHDTNDSDLSDNMKKDLESLNNL